MRMQIRHPGKNMPAVARLECRHLAETQKGSCSVRYPLGIALILTILFFTAGCLPRTVVPLRTLEYDHAPGNTKLVIFLPGRGERIGRIKDRGLFDVIRKRGYDVIVADLHLAYYVDGSFLHRLQEDVIVPAKTKGYREIWLVGNSLGGNGALFYLRGHPDEVDGIILLGPYLGERELIEEILDSGGLSRWSPGNTGQKDYNRDLWEWLKNIPSETTPVFLCYASGDRFSLSQGLLSGLLPPERVVRVQGGHDWASWKKAWDILFTRHLSGPDAPLP